MGRETSWRGKTSSGSEEWVGLKGERTSHVDELKTIFCLLWSLDVGHIPTDTRKASQFSQVVPTPNTSSQWCSEPWGWAWANGCEVKLLLLGGIELAGWSKEVERKCHSSFISVQWKKFIFGGGCQQEGTLPTKQAVYPLFTFPGWAKCRTKVSKWERVLGQGAEGTQAGAWFSGPELMWKGMLLLGVWVVYSDMLERVLEVTHLLQNSTQQKQQHLSIAYYGLAMF